MVIVSCSVPTCEFKTGDVTEALAIAMLNNHGLAHQKPPPGAVATPPKAPAPRGPKLDRPKIDMGVSIEQWNIFVRRWEVFCSGSGIDDASAPPHLFQCAGPALGDSLLKANPTATSETLQHLLSAMRSLAVIPVAPCVLRTELLQLRQERDEAFRSFTARVRGKAETCAFNAVCECGKNVNYTDHIIRDVLLNGIYDSDIRREVLGTSDILQKTVNNVIALVENKEMARNALPPSTLSAMSSFQRQKTTQPTSTPHATPSYTDRSKEATCPDCKTLFKTFTEGARGWNTKPHQVCINCYRARRRQQRQKPTTQSIESDPIAQMTAVQATGTSTRHRRRTRRTTKTTHCTATRSTQPHLGHHIFSKGEWRRARLRNHPRVPLTIRIDQKHHRAPISGNPVLARTSAVADTGAQSDLWSLEEFLAAGFSRDDLHPVTLSLSAANRSPIAVEGAFFAKLTAASQNGAETTCRSMVYVSSSVKAMYLSYESLLNLNLLGPDFLSTDTDVATCPTRTSVNTQSTTSLINSTRIMNDGCEAPPTTHDTQCSCPQRTAPPPRPTELPFPCQPENNARMKSWLLERYASSTFNTCPHRPLPCMTGPPVEIHVDPTATPKACHTPATIPIHWQQRVHEDLLRDEALGVIERVPYGEPVTWCHRMVVTRKHDGSPRRTVDLSPLNKFCQRETFASESPFHLARRIPKNTWKTVTDAWNGYHSVPLRTSDRHLTTFITPFGRWRYTRAPQGFLSSGDGYNRRFDAILSEFERKERCVDDTVHYDTDLEQHWWRTLDFLIQVGQSGIVLNADKFQFAAKAVNFAGFRVSHSTIEPLPKYLDAIRDFPPPKSTTDIRSWFGLVNQVTNYAQLRDTMAPFKPFLSPRCKFSWSPELEAAFQLSKTAIVKAIREGVEIFDLKRRTCLRPDWSNRGIGYFLLQQHCSCTSGIPDCCPDGWKITLAGSRFLSATEQRYAAIEGEALAVAWGLEQTRYFTQGCDNLVIVTDHKPLVKIFGDRTLDEISNSRLFRLKQRTLPWRFDIVHLPGKSNAAADATSRHPSASSPEPDNALGTLSEHDLAEMALVTSIRRDTGSLGAITWPLLAQETAQDATFGHVLHLLETNGSLNSRDPSVSSISPISDSLYAQDGVIMYNDRVVVPPSLRDRVLQHLHSAHQGTSTMEQRARAIVYWPGLSKDIQETRERCSDCNRNAPSQAATPPLPSPPPSTPFESIFADFFDYGGSHYLVVGDKLSGWVEVFRSTAGSDLGGSAGLIRHLRTCFATFGVPEELSSDGGPEFTAGPTKAFLGLWNVKHRVSSVSFPQSNGRAEVAVKAAKRLLMSNTGPTGQLDHDQFLHAILQLRNTPDRDCNLSPAQVLFGRPLRDSLTFVNRLEKYSNPHIRPLWRQAWKAKEEALRTRISHTTESLKAHSRPLRPLTIGDRVFLQNQQGPNPTKWDRSGLVVENHGHDQYRVKVDGSGRLTLRNRRFLRAYTPVSSPQPQTSPAPPYPPTSQAAQPTVSLPNSAQPTTTDPPAPDGPCNTSPTGTSLSTPATPPQPQGNTREDLNNPPDDPMPPPTTTDAPAQAPVSPPPQVPLQTRPHRVRRPPKLYDPETGTWVNH